MTEGLRSLSAVVANAAGSDPECAMEVYNAPGMVRGHRSIIQLGSGDLALSDDAPGELWLGKPF